MISHFKITLVVVQFFYIFSLNAQKWFLPSSTLFDVDSEVFSNNSNFKLSPYLEGHIIIHDSNDDLLFYSDGVSVWDKKHNLFPNSNNIPLHPNSSSVQGTYCIKSSKEDNIYYLLSLNHIVIPSEGELYLSKIDLSLNDGLGDIVEGSVIKIGENFTEQMEVIPNPCGGVWVINHQRDNNCFVSTHILDGDVIARVFSKIGYNSIRSRWFLGTLKSSNDKTKLLWVETGGKPIEIFNFDKSTGKLSEYLTIPENGDLTYGIYSKNDNLIYIAKRDEKLNKNYIIQYDITHSSVELILQSKTIFEVPVDLYPSMIGMEYNSKDEVVFTSSSHTSHIGKIFNPNAKGIECKLNPNAILVPNRHLTKMFAQPLIIEPSSNIDLLQKDVRPCNFGLNLKTYIKLDSLNWSTGETSEEIKVNKSGIYSLIAYKNGCLYYDTTSISFEIPRKLDTINICEGKSFNYKNKEYFVGETIKDTIYSVMCDTIVEIFLQNSKNIPIKYITKAICPNTEFEHIDGMKYRIGDTIKTVSPAVLDQCDSIIYTQIVSLPNSTASISGNNLICFGEKTELTVSPIGLDYSWNTGEKTKKIRVGAGNYDVILIDSFNCSKHTSIIINERPLWDLNIVDTVEISNVFPKEISIRGDIIRIQSIDINPFEENIHWKIDKLVINSQPENNTQKILFIDDLGCTSAHTLYYNFIKLDLIEAANVIYLNSNNTGNKEWKIHLEPSLVLKEVVIYDRYGSVVFKSNDLNQPWYGQVNGKDVEEGAYIVKIESVDSKGNIFHKFKELLILK